MYQKALGQVLQECDGVHNILDDVIVRGLSNIPVQSRVVYSTYRLESPEVVNILHFDIH